MSQGPLQPNGTDNTGVSQPTASGRGVRGWLSAIYTVLLAVYDSTNAWLRVGAKSLTTVSTANSSTTPLTGGATFTGTYENINGYTSVAILLNTDSMATSGGLFVDFSTDGVNADRTIIVNMQTGGDYCAFGTQSSYVRIRVTAGVAAQTYMRLQTRYIGTAEGLKVSPLIDSLTDASTALVARTVIFGKSTAGGTNYVAVKVNPSGSLQVSPTFSSTGTKTSVAATTTPSTTILAANANRLGATIYQDDSASTLYLALNSACTTTSYTVQLAPGGYYEVPFNYQGIITGVWSAATGNARITEMT